MKKTDAVVEDDPHLSEGEAEAEEELKEEAERPSKADLEGPEVDNDDAEVITTTEEVADVSFYCEISLIFYKNEKEI